jgi:hypothetical protein
VGLGAPFRHGSARAASVPDANGTRAADSARRRRAVKLRKPASTASDALSAEGSAQERDRASFVPRSCRDSSNYQQASRSIRRYGPLVPKRCCGL